MQTHYILIDYENVQPKNLARLDGHACKIFVFLGAHQTKIATELVRALQPHGEDVCYVCISGNGRNALDFHIAFQLGELAARDPDGLYYVISKDTGFDPLLKHLKARGIRAQRSKSLGELPIAEPSGPSAAGDQLDLIVKILKGQKAARPRKRKALASTIDSLFSKQLAEGEVDALIAGLEQRGAVLVEEGKVSYTL
jgi:hypothetical protein